MFHRGEPLTETVWEKLMLGLSTRKYGRAVREFAKRRTGGVSHRETLAELRPNFQGRREGRGADFFPLQGKIPRSGLLRSLV